MKKEDDKKRRVADRKGSAVQTDKEGREVASDSFSLEQAASAAHSLCGGLISI